MPAFALNATGVRLYPQTHGQFATNVSAGQQIPSGQSTDQLASPFSAYDCELLLVGAVGLNFVTLTIPCLGSTFQVAAQIVTPNATGGQIEFNVGETEQASNALLLPTLIPDRQQAVITVPSGNTAYTTTLYTTKNRFVSIRLRNNDIAATTSWQLKTALRQMP